MGRHSHRRYFERCSTGFSKQHNFFSKSTAGLGKCTSNWCVSLSLCQDPSRGLYEFTPPENVENGRDIAEILSILHSGAEYGWAVLSCVPTVVLENISRLLISLDSPNREKNFQRQLSIEWPNFIKKCTRNVVITIHSLCPLWGMPKDIRSSKTGIRSSKTGIRSSKAGIRSKTDIRSSKTGIRSSKTDIRSKTDIKSSKNKHKVRHNISHHSHATYYKM